MLCRTHRCHGLYECRIATDLENTDLFLLLTLTVSPLLSITDIALLYTTFLRVFCLLCGFCAPGQTGLQAIVPAPRAAPLILPVVLCYP